MATKKGFFFVIECIYSFTYASKVILDKTSCNGPERYLGSSEFGSGSAVTHFIPSASIDFVSTGISIANMSLSYLG